MKKEVTTILLSVAIWGAFIGCSKDDRIQGTKTNVPSLVFSASIASSQSNETTKTYLDRTSNNKISWIEGDEITINGVKFSATPDLDDPTKATFTTTGANPALINGKYYATYACSYDGSRNTGTLPSVQRYNPNYNIGGIYPMFAESETTELEFKNICGLLEIKLQSNNGQNMCIAGIEVLSTDDNGIYGDFTIQYEDGQPTAILTDDSKQYKKEVYLECGEVNIQEEKAFYIAVPAGEYAGLTFKIYLNDNRVWTKKMRDGAIATIKANGLYSLSWTLNNPPAIEEGSYFIRSYYRYAKAICIDDNSAKVEDFKENEEKFVWNITPNDNGTFKLIHETTGYQFISSGNSSFSLSNEGECDVYFYEMGKKDDGIPVFAISPTGSLNDNKKGLHYNEKQFIAYDRGSTLNDIVGSRWVLVRKDN